MTRMKDVSHTNPTDPRNVFGELYRRGPSTVADGGQSGEARRREAEATDEDGTDERMKDIDHTADDDADRNPNRVWSRGSRDEVAEE